MIKLGVIGHPIAHSLSPIMHNLALKEMNIEGEYTAIDTPQEEIVNTLKRLRIEGYKGFNITLPLKTVVIPFLSSVDDYANIAGAVNTVIIDDNHELHGFNTDVYGFINAIEENKREELKGKKAAILGSGGAARAVAVGLCDMGVKEIVVYARNQEKAQNLKAIIQNNYDRVKFRTRNFTEYPDLSDKAILVNTTPLGMQGNYEKVSPIKKRSIESMPKDAIVYDLIYKPCETELLKYANETGLMAINGMEMLVLQGAKALTIWTGKEAPVNIMRKALLDNLWAK